MYVEHTQCFTQVYYLLHQYAFGVILRMLTSSFFSLVLAAVHNFFKESAKVNVNVRRYMCMSGIDISTHKFIQVHLGRKCFRSGLV